MGKIIKCHWFAIVLAMVIGIIIVIPNVVSIYRTNNFAGIYPMFNNDESYYLGITKEVYDGHLNSGNTFIKEHKNDLAMQPLYFEMIPASEAKLFNLSVPKVFVLNDFLLPLLGVILLYTLFFSLTESGFLSGMFSFFFYLIFATSFNRPISPQFGFVFFILGIFIVWKIISQKQEFKTFLLLNIFLSIVFGSLVYIYPFYWTAIIVLYVVSSLILIIKEKEFIYWFRGFTVFGLTSLFFLIPYGLNALKLASDSSFLEASMRNGLVFTHWPGALFNAAFILFCFLIICLIHKNINHKEKLIFCYSIILSGVILNWQNIITGKMLQFSSHYYMVTILFVFLVLSVVVKSLWQTYSEDKEKNYRKTLAIFLSIILILLIVYRQKNDLFDTYSNIIFPPNISNVQSLAPVLNWLTLNTPPNSAIYTLGNDNYNVFIPIYTQNNVYANAYAAMSLISDDELENRWAIQNFWEDVKANDVLNAHRSIWLNEFQDTYANREVRRKIFQLVTGKKYPQTISVEQKYIDEVLEKYNNFKKMGFEKAIKTYEVDYIILDTKNSHYKNLEKQFKKYSFLENVANIGDTFVYKVN